MNLRFAAARAPAFESRMPMTRGVARERGVRQAAGTPGRAAAHFPIGASEPVVNAFVICRHHFSGETRLELFTAGLPRDRADILDTRDEFFESRTDKSGDTMAQDLRYRAAGPGNDGSPASKSLDHYESEWLRPIDREQQRERVAEKLLLLGLVYFTDELDTWSRKQGLDDRVEIFAIDAIDFCGNFQGHAWTSRDFNGEVGAFLRTDPAQESQVVSGARREA